MPSAFHCCRARLLTPHERDRRFEVYESISLVFKSPNRPQAWPGVRDNLHQAAFKAEHDNIVAESGAFLNIGISLEMTISLAALSEIEIARTPPNSVSYLILCIVHNMNRSSFARNVSSPTRRLSSCIAFNGCETETKRPWL